MNIVIISHERSLNKAEGLLRAYKNANTYLVTDSPPNKNKLYAYDARHIIISKYLDVVDITKQIPKVDKILTSATHF